MERYLNEYIKKDLDKKIILLTGPRQTGKTTLSKMLREIDFCIVSNNIPSLLLEVKWNDNSLSPNFGIFKRYFSDVKMIQISKIVKREKTFPDGTEIRSTSKWLSGFSLP